MAGRSKETASQQPTSETLPSDKLKEIVLKLQGGFGRALLDSEDFLKAAGEHYLSPYAVGEPKGSGDTRKDRPILITRGKTTWSIALIVSRDRQSDFQDLYITKLGNRVSKNQIAEGVMLSVRLSRFSFISDSEVHYKKLPLSIGGKQIVEAGDSMDVEKNNSKSVAKAKKLLREFIATTPR